MRSQFPLFRLLSLNPRFQNHHLLQKLFFSRQTWRSIPVNTLIRRSQSTPSPESNCGQPHQISVPDFSQSDFSAISNLLENPDIIPDSALESALGRTGIEPTHGLVQALFGRFSSSPKLLHSLFKWADTKPGFRSSSSLFDLVINALGKAREFDSAWLLILERIGKNGGSDLVSADTFAILIRRYARAGMVQPAIRTFEFARNSGQISESESDFRLFDILLDTLCKEGRVRAAAEYLERRRRHMGSSWVPSVRVYNVLLNGWFRSRKLKKAERLWLEMRKENITPTVVTYGTLIEGYCRMRRVEIAIELMEEMKGLGIKPNVIVYNPIIDALGEAARFKEALGMMERLLVSEQGPTISTYNSLVKGFCKAGDLSGASKILKMMTSRDIVPTPTTYNYFFKYFAKHRKTEEGMNLYLKLIEAGYDPDQLTYHLVLKMLCEDGKLNLAMQVNREMRNRGIDGDLATSTMLIHLLCRMDKLEEAVKEFENMMRRGIIPQYITFKMMSEGLRSKGMIDMEKKLCGLMSSVPHSKNLPNTYREDMTVAEESGRRRTIVLRRAEAISDALKNCNDPRELVKKRGSSEKAVWSANRLVDEINRRAGNAFGLEA